MCTTKSLYPESSAPYCVYVRACVCVCVHASKPKRGHVGWTLVLCPQTTNSLLAAMGLQLLHLTLHPVTTALQSPPHRARTVLQPPPHPARMVLQPPPHPARTALQPPPHPARMALHPPPHPARTALQPPPTAESPEEAFILGLQQKIPLSAQTARLPREPKRPIHPVSSTQAQ